MVKAGELALPEEKSPAANARKIAVIGAGPAGLTAAGTLADSGFAVTVYEASGCAGGMLLWGIPAYRLPKDILAYEVELIRRKGVRIVLNCRIGKDKTMEELRKENAAVFISAGAHMSRKLGVPGEEIAGVDFGVEFLRQAGSKDNKPHVGRRVLVIGGGNVAMDVARTALRLGAKQVEMVALEKRDEMPAYKEEIEATLAEGIAINNGWGPNRILGDGAVTGIELRECTRVFDENGRFSPAYNENNLKTINADQIIVAIGQAVNPDLLKHCGVEIGRGCFTADPVTLETSVKGIFAGGENATGPGSVIQAVAAGKRAAESIERYLSGKDLRLDRFTDTLKPLADEFLPSTDDCEKKKRAEAAVLPAGERTRRFPGDRSRIFRGGSRGGGRALPELRALFRMHGVCYRLRQKGCRARHAGRNHHPGRRLRHPDAGLRGIRRQTQRGIRVQPVPERPDERPVRADAVGRRALCRTRRPPG